MKANQKESVLESTIRVKVEFGNPKVGCARFGICKMSLVENTEFDIKRSAIGLLSLKNGELSLIFKKVQLSPYVLTKYFDEYFILECDFELPEFVASKLKLAKSRIDANQYEIIRKSKIFKILFF